MPAKPDDLYGTLGSVPAVESGGGGPVPFSVRASPQDFGSQVGEAVAKTGEVGQELAVKYQGMINETLATNAETEYMKELGAMTGEFKSKEGLEVVSSLPGYIKNVSDLRQKYRGNLPLGANHAFDMLALRHEGYAISDANTYSAAQVRQADYSSAATSIAAHVDGVAHPDVAVSDARFRDSTDNIKFQTTRTFTDSPGFTGQNAQGEAVFDDTPEGQASKADYQQRVSHAISQAYVNRYNSLMEGSVLGAFEKYQQERANIPPAAQVNLDATFAPRVVTAQARHVVDTGFGATNQEYAKSVESPEAVAKNYGTAAMQKVILGQESNNASDIQTSIDGAVGPGQIEPATFKQYARPGEDINNPTDNRNVSARIVNDLSARYNGDAGRVAVGYFSGPGNVAPPGSATPWIKDSVDGNGKSVSSYVSDIQKRLGETPVQGIPKPPNVADYYRMNYNNIIQQHMAQAEAMHPGDVRFAEMVRVKTEQRLNDVIRQQELAYKVDNDMVLAAANGSMSNGRKPTSIEDLQAINPDIKDAVDRMMINSPQTYSLLENRLLNSSSKGMGKALLEYGTPILRIQHKIVAHEITNAAQLLEYLPPDENAKGDFLTPAGFERAMSILNSMDKNSNEVKIQAAAFDGVKTKFMGTNQDYEDPKGKAAYDATVPLMYKAWEEGRAKGITPYELANPESSHWVGLATKATWLSDTQKAMNAMTSGLAVPPVGHGSGAVNIAPGGPDETPDAMRQAYLNETDPARKKAIKTRMIKLFNLVDDETPLAPVSR